MVFVAEHNAFVDRPEHVVPGVPGLQPDEGALGIHVDVAAEQKRQEDQSLVVVSGPGHRLVGVVVNAPVVKVDAFEHLRQEPFLIGGRGRAAFEDHPIARDRVNRRHEQILVDHRLFADVLVDAPGSGDHAHRRFVGDTDGHRRRVNVHRAAGHWRADFQSGQPRRFFGHVAADFAGVAQRRQLVVNAFEAHFREEGLVVADVPDVHQRRAGIIGDFPVGLAGELEADEILAHEDPAGPFDYLRLVL